MSELLTKTDLTRWNRAGLQRFRYVDGNAVTFLELLRQSMANIFTDGGVNQWSALDTEILVPANETTAERAARWQHQYHAERRDYAWEILRTLARSGHVLMEHLDMYANENFLRTATEWENVRRLVEMIAYNPAPPASAETSLALLAKIGTAGLVAKGFAVKNKPSDGSKVVVFETLTDLDVDAAVNQLRTVDWNLSQRIFIYNTTTRTAVFPLAEPLTDVAVGTLGVLVIQPANGSAIGIAVSIAALSNTQLILSGEMPGVSLPGVVRDYQVTLHLKPEIKREPLLSGAQVVELSEGHGLSIGAVIAWQAGSSWRARKVQSVAGNRVRLSSGSLPNAGEDIYLADFAVSGLHDLGGSSQTSIILPSHRAGERRYYAIWDEDLALFSESGHQHQIVDGADIYDYYVNPGIERMYYLPMRESVATVIDNSVHRLQFAGKAKKIAGGDWIIAATNSHSDGIKATQVGELIETSDSFEIIPSRNLFNTAVIHSQFSLKLQPKDANKNITPVFLTDPAYRSANSSVIPVAGSLATLIAPKRKLLLIGKEAAMTLTVKAVDAVNNLVTVEPAIPGSEPTASGTTHNYSRYDSVLYGNVVSAGQGETQNKKILGSGDATQSNQIFHLDQADVSFISEPGFGSGVRADLTITVDGRSYQQVENLNNSSAEDPHYTVRMREDATLDIMFGDGKYGRRLPSGSNNLNAVYRTGTGLAGNVAAYSLEKAVKPHHLIDSVLQPILAAGGNDMESAESMRAHAPASVLTLARAVSVSDFAHLAEANSSVWQARARREQPGMARNDSVSVAIVPAGGGNLGSLASSLQQMLLNHCMPNVNVNILRYQAVLISVNVIVNVKADEFDLDTVEAAVIAQLYSDFSLQKATLGKVFYRSQLLQSVESVPGVENCQCDLLANFIDETNSSIIPESLALSSIGQVKRISPKWYQLVYLHSELSDLNLVVQAFNP